MLRSLGRLRKNVAGECRDEGHGGAQCDAATAATAMSSCRLNHMDFAVTFAAASLFSVVVRCDVDVPLFNAPCFPKISPFWKTS